jgi:hypothetical protein
MLTTHELFDWSGWSKTGAASDLNRVGAENLVPSRDLHVFVYQAAEPVSS